MLSIVVPVYNTEIEKLDRCFKSIEQLDGKCDGFECIIVDDGSNEMTARFCKEYAIRHINFKYLRKSNGGVSSARNLGIAYTTGDFLCFVDSDDEIVSENFDKIELTIDYDVFFTDLALVSKGKKDTWKAFSGGAREVGNEIIERIICDGRLNGPVAKIFNMEFLRTNNIKFREDMILGEDAVFLMDIIRNRPTMFYYNINTYLYHRLIETGKSRVVNNPVIVIKNNHTMYEIMLELLHENEWPNYELLLSRIVSRYIKQLFNILAVLLMYNCSDVKVFEQVRTYYCNIEENYINILRKYGKTRIKILYFVVKNRQWSLVKIYSIVRKIYLFIKGFR